MCGVERIVLVGVCACSRSSFGDAELAYIIFNDGGRRSGVILPSCQGSKSTLHVCGDDLKAVDVASVDPTKAINVSNDSSVGQIKRPTLPLQLL